MFTKLDITPAATPTGGFTLIELLVVIAIIAILTAIIFPVFATIRENSRQKTAMANMHDIQNGLAQFKLDNGRYPEVLFGYAVPGARMDQALAVARAVQRRRPVFPRPVPGICQGPADVHRPQQRRQGLEQDDSGALTVNTLPSTPGHAGAARPIRYGSTTTSRSARGRPIFISRMPMTSARQIDTSGTNLLSGGNGKPLELCRPLPDDLDGHRTQRPRPRIRLNYTRQLRWTNPPPDTYITCTTHHVPNSNKVIVLWEGGEAKAMDAAQFLGGSVGGADSASAHGATVLAGLAHQQQQPGAVGTPPSGRSPYVREGGQCFEKPRVYSPGANSREGTRRAQTR